MQKFIVAAVICGFVGLCVSSLSADEPALGFKSLPTDHKDVFGDILVFKKLRPLIYAFPK